MGKRRMWKSVIFQAVAVGVGLLVIFPILYALGTSFMKSTDILSLNPRIIPRYIDFANYTYVWENTMMLRFIWNSVFITTVTCCLRVATAALAAYGYACFEFKGKNLFFYLTVGTMLIPGEATLLTNYETISKLHMINTYQGIIIMFIGSATSVFIIRQYFMGVSASIKEASEMDGCGDIRFFTKILLPISKPILVTVFITAFVEIWNVYLWPMLITNRNEMRTVQVGIAQLNSSEGSAYGIIMAGAVIVLIPSLLVFVLFQKQIINGMVTGSVKG